jgi:hypothetical protein
MKLTKYAQRHAYICPISVGIAGREIWEYCTVHTQRCSGLEHRLVLSRLALGKFYDNLKHFWYETTLKLVSGRFFPSKWIKHESEDAMFTMLSWKLHVRMSISPRKSPFIVFITPSILNKNGRDRLRKMSISLIFKEEILENCRFWEVQTSGFGLCIIYPNYLSCFKVVPEHGQRNWTISCHRIPRVLNR